MERHFKQEKLKIEVLNIREEREHFHQDIELLFVLEGTLDVAMGEQTTHMQPEDILVINANKRHCLKGSADILFARLYITYQLVSDIFESTDIIFWCDSTKGDTDRYREMRETLKKLLNHYLSTRGGVANFGHIALCYQVMDLLSSYFLARTGDRHLEDGADRFENRLSQINNYIRANYNQSISLNDLASQLYLSVGYLSRFFKKNYGMNFAAYLANVRLYHAVDDLLYTEQPVTRIAYDNGFSNVTVFNKAFKAAYGETPSAFRKQAKVKEQNAQKEENDQLVEERLEEFLRNDGLQREEQKTKEEVRIEFSVQTQEQTKYIWKDMINIGAAEDLLRSEIREHVIYLKEALQFHYVRFWNIFSKDMLIDISSGEEGYNFSRLDSILDFLLQNGLKPHIELGMKPRRLYGSVQTALIFERNEDAFPGDEKWKCVLDAMMRHLLHRYGRTEIGTWRMELWFREDTEKNWEGMKGYFRLFPGNEVRIKGAYIVRCTGCVKDADGNVTEVLCEYDPETRGGNTPDGRKVRGTIHWVDAHNCADAEVRLYDNLFADADPEGDGKDYLECLNPDSLSVLTGCKVERMLAGAEAPAAFQFLRLGYFAVDNKDSAPGHLVFNRAVALKDSFKKA